MGIARSHITKASAFFLFNSGDKDPLNLSLSFFFIMKVPNRWAFVWFSPLSYDVYLKHSHFFSFSRLRQFAIVLFGVLYAFVKLTPFFFVIFAIQNDRS